MRAIILFIVVATVISSAQDAQEIRQRTTAFENPAVQDYLERIGRKLADANSGYTFAMVADDVGGRTNEPLSLPGGFVFVPAGLILGAADEAEVAGMLAHALAHTTETRPQVNGPTIPVLIDGWNGWRLGRNEHIVPIGVFKTQRDNEARADALAVQVLSAVGYDPEGLIRYLVSTCNS